MGNVGTDDDDAEARLESARVGDGVARREGRGFVNSYGEGRRCESAGCSTTLSRYNSDPMCWVHKR